MGRTPSPQTSSAIKALQMKLQQKRAATRARTYGGQLEASRNAPRRTPSPQTSSAIKALQMKLQQKRACGGTGECSNAAKFTRRRLASSHEELHKRYLAEDHDAPNGLFILFPVLMILMLIFVICLGRRTGVFTPRGMLRRTTEF